MMLRKILALFCLFFLELVPCRAQLASSFYNVTGITATSLPNAVRLTIQTDGSVYFGGDQDDFINFDNAYEPKPTQSFRLRILGARARLPAFVPIGKYPFDSAGVSVAPAEFKIPYFNWEAPQYEPHVDIELRFYVPVKVKRFTVRPNEWGLNFGQTLRANDFSVEPSQDGQAIIVTVFTDRADTRSAKNLKRSPVENQKHRLQVVALSSSPNQATPPGTMSLLPKPSTPVPEAERLDGEKRFSEKRFSEKRFRVDVLHSPLGDVLDEVARVSGSKISASPEATATDLSMLLPAATVPQFLESLARGYGFQIGTQNDEITVGNGLPELSSTGNSAASAGAAASGAAQQLPTQHFSLSYLNASRARSLLPDFLLPAMRVDADNNALLVSASDTMARRIGADLALLDKPRAQVRVEADLWEFFSSDEANLALQTLYKSRKIGAAFGSQNGVLSLQLNADETRNFDIGLQALQSRGRVRLRAKPFLVVASGEKGTLFLGQTRYVTVFDGLDVKALTLQVGTSLEVTPRVGEEKQIALDIRPRFSTVDRIDGKSNLPTLGIREFSSSNTLRDGEAMLIGGLDFERDENERNRGALTFKTTQRNRQTRRTILLLTARRTP